MKLQFSVHGHCCHSPSRVESVPAHAWILLELVGVALTLIIMMNWSVVTGHGDHKSMKDWSFLDNELYVGYISWYWYLADSCM